MQILEGALYFLYKRSLAFSYDLIADSTQMHAESLRGGALEISLGGQDKKAVLCLVRLGVHWSILLGAHFSYNLLSDLGK